MGHQSAARELCTYLHAVNAKGADRRILNVAVVNCEEWNLRGNSVNRVRADAYAEFFVTEPAENGEIYTEFVRFMTVEDDGSKLHRIIQLYR